MAEHTPTPWTLTPRPHASWIGSIGNNPGDPQLWSVEAPYPKGDKSADAALIVRAVNNHDALVKALEGIAEFCSEDATTLGAIARLASIRNTAEQALRVVVGGAR